MNRHERRKQSTIDRLSKGLNGKGLLFQGSGPPVPLAGRLFTGGAQSTIKVVAQNRGTAPALFILDVFEKEPSDLILDPKENPGHLFRINASELKAGHTDPGLGFWCEMKIGYEAKTNAKGPLLWFRMPHELRKNFVITTLTWNGKSLLRKAGWV